MRGESILVVDDEAAIRDACVRALERRGFRAEAASNAAEALDRLDKAAYELLLTDIKMPGMSGLELVQKAREIEPQLTSVILTGYGTLGMAMESIELGVHGFLLKPFTLEELAACVEGALQKARLLRENTRLRALLPLLDVSRRLMVEQELDALYEAILTAARGESPATAAWLLVEPEPNAGRRVVPDEQVDSLPGAFLPRWPVLARYFKRSPGPLVIQPQQASAIGPDDGTAKSLESADLAAALVGLRECIGAPHAVAVPLMAAGRTVGSLVLERQTPFGESELEWLGILATQAATAIENVWLHQKTQQAIGIRDEFLSIAAHELKTPIAVIQGYADLLVDQMPGHSDPADVAAIQAIGRQSAGLARLVEEVLVVSRLQHGQLELRLARWDLGELVAQVLAEMQGLSPHHRLLLDQEPGLFVEADRARIEQVLRNILSNAIRFSPEGGLVRAHLSAEDGAARVSIQDQGPGIPAKQQDRLFERFYRPEAGTQQSAGGIGLGLYVSRELVVRHGGRMWVESEERIGSTFSFTLPLAVQTPRTSSAAS